jgi:hypothetical protein
LIGSKEVCMRPTEDAIARAFGLATPVAPLKLVHHTSFETWHLSTGAGSYLVKRLWGLEDPVWRPHIERAISLEAAALASGLPVACPSNHWTPGHGDVSGAGQRRRRRLSSRAGGT